MLTALRKAVANLRALLHDDQQGSQVAIVNESFAQRFLPNENPVGKSIRMLPPLELLPKDALAQVGSQIAPMRTIVGVIADMIFGRAQQGTQNADMQECL